MKIIIHLLETQNQFGRDRVAEDKAKKLAKLLVEKGLVTYSAQITKIDYYNKDETTALEAELLKQDKEVFHVVIPGGQCAQESLVCLLDDKTLNNTFVVYNSHWDMLNQKEIQFGKIAADLHYNLAETTSLASLNGMMSSLELCDAMLIFSRGMVRFPSADEYVNVRERASLRESQDKNNVPVEQELSEKITRAIQVYQSAIDHSNTTTSFKQKIG